MILTAIFLALAAAFPAPAQQPDFSAVAAQAARAVEKFKSDSVVVLDFVGPEIYVSELGRSMADQFSVSLANVGGKFVVVDRAKMRQAIESNRFAPEIVADPDIAASLAQSIGADSAILGHLSRDGSAMQLTIDCIRVKDGNISGTFRASYPLTNEWKALMAKNVDSDSGVFSVDSAAQLPETQRPSCSKCSMPQFTPEAMKEKYDGTAEILAVIGKDGLARDFRIVKSLRYGLTVAAAQALQRWTFNPAKGPDGEPIDLRVPIEVVFRLY